MHLLKLDILLSPRSFVDMFMDLPQLASGNQSKFYPSDMVGRASAQMSNNGHTIADHVNDLKYSGIAVPYWWVSNSERPIQKHSHAYC